MNDWLRPDGTEKRGGFLGELKRPDGGVMTEYSVGVPIFGQETEIPTLVPTLSRDQVDWLLNTEGERIPDDIVDKAVQHAQIRVATGQSPFAGDSESPSPTRPPGPWRDEYVMPNSPSRMLNMLLSTFRR